MLPSRLATFVIVLCYVVVSAALVRGAEPLLSDAEREFFESKIRPVLVEHCYECHNTIDGGEGGLILDHREPLIAGGDRGVLLNRERPGQSLLVRVLRHEIDGLEMPEGGPKLDEAVARDFEQWISMGAPDPRVAPPSSEELAEATSWEQKLARRKQWWSFRPIEPVEPPGDPHTTADPIDRFVDQSLRRAGLTASPRAEPATLVRRMFFAITGLPPTANEAIKWTRRIGESDDPASEIDALAKHLLASPHFGERWARHWMDWIRYAESHGSEGDPRIENAWHYRDYLIRALNADVPYDQLVKEHLAGDLLPGPRTNETLGINESAIGTAQLRMVFHGFAPTDALDEKVRFIDDQINVISKAFLGLTVSCARCHHHKFDAISQDDYYAMFGVLASCRPGRNVVDLPERQNLHRDELTRLKNQIQDDLALRWESDVEDAIQRLIELPEDRLKETSVGRLVSQFKRLADTKKGFAAAWREQASRAERYRAAEQAFDSASIQGWDLGDPENRGRWYSTGVGLESDSRAGQWTISLQGNRIVDRVFPSGTYTHLLSSKHPGRFTSPDFVIDDDATLWVETLARGAAGLRYVVQDYPRNGTVYPVKRPGDQWKWEQFDLSYWAGDSIHVELATAKDAPLLTADQPRSWFGLRRVAVTPRGTQPPPLDDEPLLAILRNEDIPVSWDQFRSMLAATLRDVIKGWRDNRLDDSQARLLDEWLRLGVLNNSTTDFPAISDHIRRYRKLENEIPVPTRVPGLDESVGADQALMIRGNHKNLGEPVPRRFLEAIDDSAYQTTRSGRLELANDLLREDNPLTRRVIVNRVWHHLFGRGIVSTPDNFGRLGAEPSHPELLDHLADRFAREGWSIKKLIRTIVTSETWLRSPVPSPEASAKDPENVFLSHANVRRLEAESIRDSLLTVSGRLDDRLHGPPVGADSTRRSVYIRVIRNALDPFLRAFDFPEPFSAVGRRDVTNVPAQSLAMLNEKQVARLAEAWARKLSQDTLAESSDSESIDPERQAENETRLIRTMFLDAFGRVPGETEVDRAREYLDQTRRIARERAQERSRLSARIGELQRQLSALLAEASAKLAKDSGSKSAAFNANDAVTPLPKPIGRWDFTKGLEDLVGEADAELKNGAVRSDGGLELRSGGYALTDPVQQDLSEKTLEVWVQLDNLAQRAGGAMTVQTRDGGMFDAIVFAEQQPGHWLAGSNHFARTQRFDGQVETDAHEQPVHFAITYDREGQVAGYRNGVPYGRSYRSNGPQPFRKGETIVGFGLRHLPPGGNRHLSGRILQANLYATALTPQQIASSSRENTTFFTDEELLAQLSEQQRAIVAENRQSIESLRKKLVAIPAPEANVKLQALSDLAHTLFLFQEFIYVR